jgi:hypothetical protein
LRGLLGRPFLHVRFQYVQRHGTVFEHGVMKLAHIEFRPELLLRFRAQLANFHLADLVG